MHYGVSFFPLCLLLSSLYTSEATVFSIQRRPLRFFHNKFFIFLNTRTNPLRTNITNRGKSLAASAQRVVLYQLAHMFSWRDPEPHREADDTRGIARECSVALFTDSLSKHDSEKSPSDDSHPRRGELSQDEQCGGLNLSSCDTHTANL